MNTQISALPETTAAHLKPEKIYPPLEQVTRSHIPTADAAYYCNRAEQTMRMWHCLQPKGAIRATKINGRLAWKVSDILALLAGGAQ